MSSKITLRKRTPKKYSFEEEEEDFTHEENEGKIANQCTDSQLGRQSSARKVSIETYDTDNETPEKQECGEFEAPSEVPAVEVASRNLMLKLDFLRTAAC